MDLVVPIVFLMFIGVLAYCALDAMRHVNKTPPPKSH